LSGFENAWASPRQLAQFAVHGSGKVEKAGAKAMLMSSAPFDPQQLLTAGQVAYGR
jgi:hypothetical protein